jgi:hypothetical protein
MARVYPEIDASLAAWLRAQHLFFVATAPLAGDGLINCSPKGLDTLAILGPTTVAYLDLTGSGIETVAHLRENGRIVLMFCAMEGAPKIVRLHGAGTVVEPHMAEFAALRPHFPDLPGVRSIIKVEVSRISDSCGFGVPLYAYQGERDAIVRWAESKGPEGIAAYQARHNRHSVNGLPGVTVPEATSTSS